MNEANTAQLLIRLPNELKEALNKMAIEEQISISEICRVAISEKLHWYHQLDDL